MSEQRNLRLLFALTLVTGLFGGYACGEDPPIIDEGDRSAPTVSTDAGPANDVCPSAEPKVGSACPGASDTTTRCTYVLESCKVRGISKDRTASYCCSLGAWTQCGSDDVNCDSDPSSPEPEPETPPAPEVDAAAPLDAPRDASPDGAADAGAGPDLAPEAAVDLALADAPELDSSDGAVGQEAASEGVDSAPSADL